MKKCIWCLNDETGATFNRIAHTVPQSLGGKNICQNVCDECNSYFGNYEDQNPPIESVIKETFNISRARFLMPTNEIGRNKAMARFKSSYFEINFEKPEIKPKGSYKLQKGFQEKLGRQLKRGIYKMILEEIERQFLDGHNSKYNFIREFARNNNGDLPLFYYERKHGIIIMSVDWAKSPELFINQDMKMKYLFTNDHFLEIEFLGHVLGIAISENWEIEFQNYVQNSRLLKKDLFNGFKIVQHFSDIDFTLRILNDR